MGQFLFAVLFALAILSQSAEAKLKWQSTGPGGGGAFEGPSFSALARTTHGARGSVFIGSDLSGVYRSTDMGQNWEPLGSVHGLTSTHVDMVANHSSKDGIVVLAADDGLYQSEDCGTAPKGRCDFTKKFSGFISTLSNSEGNSIYAAGLLAYCQMGPHLWRSSDDGRSWQAVSAKGLPTNANIMGLRVQPGNSKTIIAISLPERFSGPDICGAGRWPSPSPNRAFISHDAGASFSALQIPSANPMLLQTDSLDYIPWAFIEDVKFDLVSPQKIWATVMPNPKVQGADDVAVDGETYLSDGRDNFTLMSNQHTGQIWPLSNGDIRLIDLRRQRPWDIKPYYKTDEAGVWQFQVAGQNWEHVTSAQDYSSWSTAWTALISAPGGSFNGGVQTLAYLDDQTAWWVDGQFAFETRDGGHKFNQAFARQMEQPLGFQSRGLDNAVAGILVPSADQNFLYAGYFDMGCWVLPNAMAEAAALSWHDCNGPKSEMSPDKPLLSSPFNGSWKGFGGNTTALAVDPENSSRVWAVQSLSSSEHGDAQGEHYKIIESGDNFKTWNDVTGNLTDLSRAAAITSLVVDIPKLGGRRLWAIAGNLLFVREQTQSEWKHVTVVGCDGAMLVMAQQGNTIFVGGAKGVCFSHDQGRSWGLWKFPADMGAQTLTWWTPFSNAPHGVTDFAFDPRDARIAYLTAMLPDYDKSRPEGGLYKTTDGGAHWQQVESLARGSFERNFMRTVAVNPHDPKMIVVGSSSAMVAGGYFPQSKTMGAFVSRDDGRSWSAPENDGLAWPFITRLRFTSGTNPRLFGVSPGQGIVFSDLH